MLKFQVSPVTLCFQVIGALNLLLLLLFCFVFLLFFLFFIFGGGGGGRDWYAFLISQCPRRKHKYSVGTTNVKRLPLLVKSITDF